MATIEAPGTAAVHGRLWGARARDWADIQEGQHPPDYEAVFARLGLPAGASYRDVGCGSGIAALIASQRGARVWGLDAAEKLIEIARARVPSGDFCVGEMEELPFPDDMFDLVTWGSPEAMGVASLITALTPLLPPRPSGALGIFALSDEGALRALAVMLQYVVTVHSD